MHCNAEWHFDRGVHGFSFRLLLKSYQPVPMFGIHPSSFKLVSALSSGANGASLPYIPLSGWMTSHSLIRPFGVAVRRSGPAYKWIILKRVLNSSWRFRYFSRLGRSHSSMTQVSLKVASILYQHGPPLACLWIQVVYFPSTMPKAKDDKQQRKITLGFAATSMETRCGKHSKRCRWGLMQNEQERCVLCEVKNYQRRQKKGSERERGSEKNLI